MTTATKVRPILMHARSVRGIIEGRKRQTRRIVKPQPSGAWATPGRQSGPYGRVGDLLWVRETWSVHRAFDADAPRDLVGTEAVHYHADGSKWEHARVRASIHMPRWASRITLRVTDVRVERVREISGVDAVAEGCAAGVPDYELAHYGGYKRAREEFAQLWDETNGAGAWDRNDWVWVIGFERVEA